MAVREDLISSAITFLHDPSVANSPLDKKIAFLQSKNLTQEEIDVSLSRVGESGAPSIPPQGNYGYQQQPVTRQPPGYSQYPGAYWQQPPPEPPRRDWRDYFIMATVMGGVGYGVYTVAKRYIIPLIAPPTPPQLEQDKSQIDEAFNRAFTLIEQVSTDTAAIKASEEARKERLDTALTEIEVAVEEMKSSSRRRDDDNRRISDEVRALQAMIPKAMKTQEDSTEARMKELNAELKSLKTLVANRMGGRTPSPAGLRPAGPAFGGANMYGPQGTASANGTFGAPANSSSSAPVPEAANGTSSSEEKAVESSLPTAFGRPANRAGIPAWQLAATLKRQGEAEQKNTFESGTMTDANGATS